MSQRVSDDDLARIRTYMEGGENIDHDEIRALLADLEEAREENTKLREFRKVIYEHLDKALTAMDRWPRASAPREKWLIRWTYLLQAVSAGPRIEDVLDNVAATEQEEKQNA